MGWTVDALKDGKYLDADDDSELLTEFHRIAEILRTQHGGVDIFFKCGGLHLSRCKRAMADATCRSVDGEIWTPDDVKEIYAASNWKEPSAELDRMAFWNVKLLMETCCRFGLGLELNL